MEQITTRLRESVIRAKGERKNSQGNGKEAFSIQDQRDIESAAAYAYAKKKGLWVEDLYHFGIPFSTGNENTNVLHADEAIVYKSNNLMNSKTISALINRVVIYNKLFPEVAYQFVGFTGFTNGANRAPYIELIYRQDLIDYSTPATLLEIADYMRSIGFLQVSPTSYSNGENIVSDLFPRNVLKDEFGDLYVIDAEIETIQESSSMDSRNFLNQYHKDSATRKLNRISKWKKKPVILEEALRRQRKRENR